ncbi:MAG: AAA family ATPase [Pseudomonadales bacterium]|jgi:MoxR-like ATPase|nr:AAA family ATPase [Pseudomonadales bacterium]MCP5333743.1 AAA family ATPase [Pseudomonadales bacterium]HMU90832.1 AAA family ATPase [Pseudomonadales bacterium]HMW14671.1 AAA family ATPase [Pseudomonadales bacterium]HMW83906.1 AAA family ATPase [Pseudomonadales bacterium]
MQKLVEQIIAEVGRVVLGKERQVRLALGCLIAGGHLLIEDLPGMGKTTLAQTLARVLGLEFSRIQFTSDLLPADILGVSLFSPQTQQFNFRPGPLFAQLVLADEINRATPKTQSALLEAMEEQQATVDGVSHPLPQPFFVIATQNPVTQLGTFALPESQLDRFLMRIDIGYPHPAVERRMLAGEMPRQLLEHLAPLGDATTLLRLRQAVRQIKASDALLDYVQALIAFSRNAGHFVNGLSPRGAQAMMESARAWALLAGRDYLLPEDIQAILPSVVDHRLQTIERDAALPSALMVAAVDPLARQRGGALRP